MRKIWKGFSDFLIMIMCGRRLEMGYRVHRFDFKMESENRLEQFLNSLEGEVVAIVPNTRFVGATGSSSVNFLLIVEKISNK